MQEVSYTEIFRRYAGEVRLFEFSQCPVERDLFILGSNDFERILPNWLSYIEGTTNDHPNNFASYIHGSCRFADPSTIDIFTEIDLSKRFHGACKKLLARDFIFCFQVFDRGERPFIIVNQEWFDRVRSDLYCTYGLIDIVGVRKYLQTHGEIKKHLYKEYRDSLDKIALELPMYSFITFTDNIILKTNWGASTSYHLHKYNPEEFLLVIKRIQDAIQRIFGLKSYAIVTQGAQLFEGADPPLEGNARNHFFIESIATPFIELFEIDSAIAERKRADPTILGSLYLSKSLLLSLRFLNFGSRDILTSTSISFDATKSGVSMNSFVSTDLEEIIANLEFSKI